MFAYTRVRPFADTVDKFRVLEYFDKDTIVCYNLHKRVWPAAARDSVILSHIRRLKDAEKR